MSKLPTEEQILGACLKVFFLDRTYMAEDSILIAKMFDRNPIVHEHCIMMCETVQRKLGLNKELPPAFALALLSTGFRLAWHIRINEGEGK